jgi:ATP-binding cassette subfamily F protein 3
MDEFQAMDGDNYESNIRKQLKLVEMEKKENLSISQLSGGEYKLLQVIKAMLVQPNLLIMDEPDVFLDFENLNGLCKLINSYKGTLLVVTHNRYLLNHCFDKILHLENTDIQEFDGSYIEYNFALLQKKIELTEQAKKDKDEIARNEEIVNRMRTAATNASIAALGRTLHARETHLERLRARQIKEPFLALKMPQIQLPEVEVEPDKIMLSVWDYEVAFDELLLSDVCFELHGNEKVAIVGANGTGKTTLLRDIYKNHHPSITIGEDVKVEFLSQTYDEKEKSTLSGGEQNLMQIERICQSDANLLLLDEPTSHLDTYTQIALEKAIREYKGAVLMVSHDFYNIVNCADYILYVDDKSVRRMHIRSFRKMVYETHFDKEYLELEQKKIELEMRIEKALKDSDVKTAKDLCEQLGEIVQKLVV